MTPPIKNVSDRLRHYMEFAAYACTRRRLANGPRFTPGRVPILGWELDFVDGPALTSCVDTVVIEGWNDFIPDNDRPYIIDCRANIGVTVLN